MFTLRHVDGVNQIRANTLGGAVLVSLCGTQTSRKRVKVHLVTLILSNLEIRDEEEGQKGYILTDYFQRSEDD
jgi:hypothetical protein